MIQRWKDRGLTPDKVSTARGRRFRRRPARSSSTALYQERLATLNAVDFGDLLLHNLTLFQNNPEILANYQQRFRYVLVDEYQDTNVAQYLWLRLLAQQHKNICCVGDDDQSIYSWRGAEIGNILRFESDFPGARIVRLEENYRSTPQILAAAAGLIAHNRGRLGQDAVDPRRGGRQGHRARAVGRRAGGALGRRRDRGAAAQGPCAVRKSRSWCAPASRPASSRSALSPLACPIASSAARASTSARKSAMRWPICAWSTSQPTTSPSSASSTCPGAASAPPALQSLHAVARAEGISLVEATQQPHRRRRAAAGRRATRWPVSSPMLDRWRGGRRARQPCRAGPAHPRRIGLYRHVAGRQVARRARPARKPQGAGGRDGRVREPRRVSRTCQPGDGQRRATPAATWSI